MGTGSAVTTKELVRIFESSNPDIPWPPTPKFGLEVELTVEALTMQLIVGLDELRPRRFPGAG